MCEDLAVVHAERQLARLRRDRENFADGDSRTLLRMEVFPEMLDRTAYEVICEFAAGETSWEDVLAELTDWPFTFPEDAEPGNPLSARTVGTWGDVELAYGIGMITTAQYWHLYWRAAELQDDNDNYNKEAQ